MDLVFHHVVKFQHIVITNCGVMIERFTGSSVIKLNLTVCWEAGFLELALNLLFGQTVQNRSGDFIT